MIQSDPKIEKMVRTFTTSVIEAVIESAKKKLKEQDRNQRNLALTVTKPRNTKTAAELTAIAKKAVHTRRLREGARKGWATRRRNRNRTKV